MVSVVVVAVVVFAVAVRGASKWFVDKVVNEKY